MSDIPGAWFHCSRCGALFRGTADADQRGACPECGGDPVAGTEATEAPGPVLIRRKVRKPKERSGSSSSRSKHNREGQKKARALAIFVVVWAVVLGTAAIWLKGKSPDASEATSVLDAQAVGGQAMEDSRLLQDQIQNCARRLEQFVGAGDIGGRSPHVLRAKEILPEMAAALKYEPILSSDASFTLPFYQVIHTPAGRAIETMWKEDDGKFLEAVFFEEEGEWKIDWHAFSRASSEPWPQFVSGKGKGEGVFRVLARERVGANGRDPEFIGLVLYAPRPGRPGEAFSPSPEIRVTRASDMGRAIEEAFTTRAKNLGPFGSGVVKYDPGEMIRLHVRVTREGAEERTFKITDLLATHWMELPPAK
ncbi:FmdB family zinc ribbon protein [Luteolibacter soli]|uniref:Zinc ribbon domain-containing protein n=1 Tax=Luteolibacter soli TaxID=3135280 RepID=A0ABU9B2J0_9BACT